MPNASWTGNLRAVKWNDMEAQHGGCHGKVSRSQAILPVVVGMGIIVNFIEGVLVQRKLGTLSRRLLKISFHFSDILNLRTARER